MTENADFQSLSLVEKEILLASACRKMLLQHDYDGVYIDVHSSSMCVDGWVNDLTPDEVSAINEVLKDRE